MIVDTSALVAILWDEPDANVFRDAIVDAGLCQISVATFVEASMVLEGSRGYDGLRDFDLFVATAAIELVPVDVEQARVARDAFRQYGKGRHRAGLNYGDCFSYALAKVSGSPLLFKGDDFSRTDVLPVI